MGQAVSGRLEPGSLRPLSFSLSPRPVTTGLWSRARAPLPSPVSLAELLGGQAPLRVLHEVL